MAHPCLAGFSQDWAKIKAQLSQPEQAQQPLALDPLKAYFLPLKGRLQQILQVQAQAQSESPSNPARLRWALKELTQSIKLASTQTPWTSHPKQKELLDLLQQAAKAQEKANQLAHASQVNRYQKSQAQARSKTQEALALLNKKQEDKQDKPGQEKNPDQPKDSQSNSSQNKDQQGQKKSDQASKKKEPSSESPKPQQQPSKPTTDSKDQNSAEASQAKEALKKLLKLKQQGEQNKELNKQKLGVRNRSQQAVEKDW